MKSGTSYFNGPLFRKTVQRFWPLWFSYAFVLALALPVKLAGRLGRAVSEQDAARLAQFVPLEFLSGIGLFMAPVMGCAAAMAVYSHLYSQRSAAAYGMLPIRREGVFVSVTLAGLLPLIAVDLLAALGCLAAGAAQFEAVLPAAAAMFCGMSLMVLAYFGIAAFCAQLTGSIIILPILFVAVNIGAVVFEGVTASVVGEFVYGYTARDYGLELFSPFVGMPLRSQYSPVYQALAGGELRVIGYEYTGWAYSCCCAAAGALLLWPSGLLYKRRRLETAGDVVAISILRPVFRYCAATACALLLAFLLSDLVMPDAAGMGVTGALIFALFMLLGGLIGWLAAEMLVQKSFRVFRMGRKWFGFGALWLLLSGLLMCGELDITGFERRVPEPGEVKSVKVQASGEGSMLLEEPGNIGSVLELHRRIVENKARYEPSEYGQPEHDPQVIRLEYELKDGRRLNRQYYIDLSMDPVDVELLEAAANSHEGILSRKLPGIRPEAGTISYAMVSWGTAEGGLESLELGPAEAAELYNECILPDMEDCTIGRVWYGSDGGYLEEVCDCRVSLELERDAQQGFETEYFYTYATIWSERTNAWLAERGVPLLTPAQLGHDRPLA